MLWRVVGGETVLWALQICAQIHRLKVGTMSPRTRKNKHEERQLFHLVGSIHLKLLQLVRLKIGEKQLS